MTQTPNHDDFCERIEVDIGVGVQTSPCYCDYRKLERETIELKRQLAEAQRDAERFLWWFSKDRSSNGEIANLLLRQISGDSPTVIEWRNTIDQAIQEQKK